MKKLILSVLATMPFDQVCYAMRDGKCKTIDQLVEKLAKCYTKDDVKYIPSHIAYAYEEDLNK